MARKLGRTTDQRMAILRNQVSELLWFGRIETTVEKAKEVKKLAEKLITVAMRNCNDTVKVMKLVKVAKAPAKKGGEVTIVKEEKEFINDGAKKLAARRKLMSFLRDIQELKKDKESKSAYHERTKDVKHPLVEKMFNVYGVKYADVNGGYTRIIRLGFRRGDAAEMAIIELV